MGDCRYVPECPFFRDELGYSPELADKLKHIYCLGDWDACARYVAFSELGVSDARALDDVFPSDTDKLDRFIPREV